MGQAKDSGTVYVSGLGIDADTDAMSKKFKKKVDELQRAKSLRGGQYKKMLFHTCVLGTDFAPLDDIIDYLRVRENFQKIILVNCSNVEEFVRKVEELGRSIITIPSWIESLVSLKTGNLFEKFFKVDKCLWHKKAPSS